jgi:hypothetical protein
LAMRSLHLLAGLGGEGEPGGDASLFVKTARSRSVDGSNHGGFLLPPSSLAHHGGEKEVKEDEGALDGCYLMSARCYIDELQQVAGNHAAAIHGREGGAPSTSDVEALNQLCLGCSKLALCEVIRSPQGGDGPRQQALAGKGLRSSWLWFFGGNAWRTPAMCGRGSEGPDCFFYFCPRVCCVILEGPSSNYWFLRARDARGPLCKLYLPRLDE